MVNLLYISGHKSIDQLVEKKYPGEDVYVSFSKENDFLQLTIKDFSTELGIKDIGLIKFLYDEGLIQLNYFSDEYLFSYGNKISCELLSFVFELNVAKEIPEFIANRYRQMQDKEIFGIIDTFRESVSPNDYIYYYNDIEESGYSGIIESFAPQALYEAPLLYIKYVDSETKENGFLITYNRIYAPDKSVEIKYINSIRFDEGISFLDKIDCYINEEFFTTMKLIIWDSSVSNFPFQHYSEIFPAKEILSLIVKIYEYLKTKSENNLVPQ